MDDLINRWWDEERDTVGGEEKRGRRGYVTD
jgi:hypothetical protein